MKDSNVLTLRYLLRITTIYTKILIIDNKNDYPFGKQISIGKLINILDNQTENIEYEVTCIKVNNDCLILTVKTN